MAMSPAGPNGKRPHPAWRARRVTAVVSGVAFVGLATGMAVEASTSPARAVTPASDPTPNAPTVSTTEPTWAAPLSVPQATQPQVHQRAHTQTSGS